eukprot:1264250-Amphidinium_carterae.1
MIHLPFLTELAVAATLLRQCVTLCVENSPEFAILKTAKFYHTLVQRPVWFTACEGFNPRAPGGYLLAAW